MPCTEAGQLPSSRRRPDQPDRRGDRTRAVVMAMIHAWAAVGGCTSTPL